MANICLIPSKVAEFKKALKEKEISLADLLNLDHADLVEKLKPYAGESATQVATLIEEKLILKNRMVGLTNALSKLTATGKYSPAEIAKLNKIKTDYRAAQMERVFSPKENESYLGGVADKIMKTEITQEEAKNVFELSKKVEDLKKNFDGKQWADEKTAADYGAAQVIYKKYVDNLKTGNPSIKGMITEYSQEIKNLWQENKPKAVAKVMGDFIINLSNVMINARASWDNSFIGRQGAITLIKSPKIWWDMAGKSMTDFYKTLKGASPEDVLMAQVYSDPDYINGNYKKAGITFGIEEEVPTKILERIPVVGKIFKASDVTFTDSAIRAKMGLFKMFKKVYNKTGLELTDPIIRDIGTITNAIVGRGKVGQIGSSKLVQILMWAPRLLKGDWDVLTGHTFGVGLETNWGRKQAAKTILGVVIATAAILAIAKALGGKVETDPRSSDFLSMKKGNTRIKVPFARGMPQIIILASRTIMALAGKPAYKSSTTGIISKLNTGEYGSRTAFDVGLDFLVNKTTPPAGMVIDLLKGEVFGGAKPTVGNLALGTLPISVQNFIQLKGQDGVAAVAAFLDLFGVSSNTYDSSIDWGENTGTGIILKQFQEKVGEEKFKEANDKFNKRYNDWLKTLGTNEKYQEMSDDEKQKAVTKKKTEIKNAIFSEYNFKYKK